VAFSTPIQTDVTQIIVTGPGFGPVASLSDLGGKEVYANPLTTYYQNLQKANEELQKEGKKPIIIKAADKNLMDDDLVQMVNAGLIPATVTTKQRADLWSQVLDRIQPHPDLVIASGEQLAWVMRKNNPQLKSCYGGLARFTIHCVEVRARKPLNFAQGITLSRNLLILIADCSSNLCPKPGSLSPKFLFS
jgi:membrane-bound lytic murein transglycosylase MltF